MLRLQSVLSWRILDEGNPAAAPIWQTMGCLRAPLMEAGTFGRVVSIISPKTLMKNPSRFVYCLATFVWLAGLPLVGCSSNNSSSLQVATFGGTAGTETGPTGGQAPSVGGSAGNSSNANGGVGNSAGAAGATGTGGTPIRSSLATNHVMTACETPGIAVQAQRIEAECGFGPTTGNCKGNSGGQQGTQLENSNTDVGYIEGGDYLYFAGVPMDGINTLQFHYSKGVDGGGVEVRLDSNTGQLIGTLTPSSTGSWTTWADATVTLSPVTGTHTLYFVFTGSSTTGILSLDWFQTSAGGSVPVFHLNQVGFDTQGAKHAVVEGPAALTRFLVVGEDGTAAWCGDLTAQSFGAWGSSNAFYSVDFTELTRQGTYRLQVGNTASSKFTIADNQTFTQTFPGVLGYFKAVRADDADVWAADASIPIYGTSTRVDVRGGWYDASADISKYLTHLSYTNFMNPQQIPLVAWALAWVYDQGGSALAATGNAPALQAEALWGADFLLRMLDPTGYFYTTVFDSWSGDVNQRQICAFSGANGDVNGNYQSALREGGGMSIAALARAAHFNANGAFTSAQYLAGAEKAFTYLNTNGVQYADDGKENVIDDYAGLLAASELHATTQKSTYLDAARARASSLIGRLGTAGYFIADGASRPFWHASDAGLPVVALVRYLQVETDEARRSTARSAIQTHLNYLTSVTRAVTNPFGYARQPISATATGFFIPHDNESGYWWQGENARLGSLAAAALLGSTVLGVSGAQYLDWLRYAGYQLDWILGANPYDVCFVQGFGVQNPPAYCSSKPQSGTLPGGIANGITGLNTDGSGIQWPGDPNSCWDNWRWVEQWIPHAAWYLVAITALTH